MNNYENLDEIFSHLKRMRTILNYQVAGGGAYIIYAVNMLAYSTIKDNVWALLFIFVAAAVLLMPYMLFVLYKLGKKGWIIFFNILVILPLLVIVIFLHDLMFFAALVQIPLLLFYFYCFLLRFPVNEWTKEMGWKIYRIEQKKQKEQDLDFQGFRNLKG